MIGNECMIGKVGTIVGWQVRIIVPSRTGLASRIGLASRMFGKHCTCKCGLNSEYCRIGNMAE